VNQTAIRKGQLLEGAAVVFERATGGKPSKLVELTLENNFLEAALGKAGCPARPKFGKFIDWTAAEG
jgi:hypothetical protein